MMDVGTEKCRVLRTILEVNNSASPDSTEGNHVDIYGTRGEKQITNSYHKMKRAIDFIPLPH